MLCLLQERDDDFNTARAHREWEFAQPEKV